MSSSAARRGWAGLAVFLCAGSALANIYTIDTIADTTADYVWFSQAPAINHAGLVAFHTNLATGGTAVLSGDGTGETTIFYSLSSAPIGDWVAINDAGAVALSWDRFGPGAGTTILTGNGGPTTPIAGPDTGFGVASPQFDLNAAGQVAFLGSSLYTPPGLYVGGAGPTVPLYTSGGPGGFNQFGETPALNNLGTAAFLGEYAPGAWGIFSGNGGPPVLHADQTGPFNVFSGAPDINDAGAVLFQARLDSGLTGLFLSHGGGLTPLVDNAGAFDTIGFSPALNNLGAYAFFATLDGAPGPAIFTGPDPVANRVIGVGDPLNGSTITALDLRRGGLNDAGRLVFWAQLSNGVSGVYRATPIPEPASGVVLGAGLVALCLRRRRRT